MTTVTYEQATRHFEGAERPAVHELDLDIGDGEFLVVAGPAGSGKSTSLRMLAGLERPDNGHVRIGERDVAETDPRKRDIAMVFQNCSLYPHMSVADNLGFPLKVAKVAKEERVRRVRETARLLNLEPFLSCKPKALSDEQKQRVAMGRAIVREPQVFLMDEPLSGLDSTLRTQTRTQIAQLQRKLDTTTVYVTHDQAEAMTMGDRVAVLRDGELQQCATPRELYRNPVNTFVAGFIGSPRMNMFTLPVSNGVVTLGDWPIPLPWEVADAAGSEVVVGIRPEHFEIGTLGIEIDVDIVEEFGSDAYVYGRTTATGQAVVASAGWRTPPARSTRVFLHPAPAAITFFASDAEGRRLA